jgi:hypothetical protein
MYASPCTARLTWTRVRLPRLLESHLPLSYSESISLCRNIGCMGRLELPVGGERPRYVRRPVARVSLLLTFVPGWRLHATCFESRAPLVAPSFQPHLPPLSLSPWCSRSAPFAHMASWACLNHTRSSHRRAGSYHIYDVLGTSGGRLVRLFHHPPCSCARLFRVVVPIRLVAGSFWPWGLVEVGLGTFLVRGIRPVRCADCFLRLLSLIVRASSRSLHPPRTTCLAAPWRAPPTSSSISASASSCARDALASFGIGIAAWPDLCIYIAMVVRFASRFIVACTQVRM